MGAKSVALSDCSGLVLKRLEENIKLNNNEYLKNSLKTNLPLHGNGMIDYNAGSSFITKCTVLELDWYSPVVVSCDVILCSDVVFNPDLITPLLSTLKLIMINNSECCCYIAITKRNPETFNLFKQKLFEFGFTVNIFTHQETWYYYPEELSPRYIFKISITL